MNKKILPFAMSAALSALIMTSCGRSSNHSLFETAIGSVEKATTIEAKLYNKRGTSTAETSYEGSDESDSTSAGATDKAVDFVQGIGQAKPKYVWAKMGDAYDETKTINEYSYIYKESEAESKNTSAKYLYDDIKVTKFYDDTETKHALAASFTVDCAAMNARFEKAPYVCEVSLFQMNGYVGNSVAASYEYKLTADASKASDPLVAGNYDQWIHRFGWKEGKMTAAHKVDMSLAETLIDGTEHAFSYEYYVVDGDNLPALHDAIGETFAHYDSLAAKSWKIGEAAFDWSNAITGDIAISCSESF